MASSKISKNPPDSKIETLPLMSGIDTSSTAKYVGVVRPHNAISGVIHKIMMLGIPSLEQDFMLVISAENDVAYVWLSGENETLLDNIVHHASFAVVEWTY